MRVALWLVSVVPPRGPSPPWQGGLAKFLTSLPVLFLVNSDLSHFTVLNLLPNKHKYFIDFDENAEA